MPDFDEFIRQDVQEKAADELGGVQSHQLGLIVVIAISIFEGDFMGLDLDQAVVGDGHPVGISPQILHDVFGITKWWFAVHVPFLAVEGVQKRLERAFLFEGGNVSRERYPALVISLLR